MINRINLNSKLIPYRRTIKGGYIINIAGCQLHLTGKPKQWKVTIMKDALGTEYKPLYLGPYKTRDKASIDLICKLNQRVYQPDKKFEKRC